MRSVLGTGESLIKGKSETKNWLAQRRESSGGTYQGVQLPNRVGEYGSQTQTLLSDVHMKG